MSDAYEPKLAELVFSQDEADAITAALKTATPWDVKNDFIKSAKGKIRDHHLVRHGNTCCYCRTILHGGGHFMIDREHILPKGTLTYRSFCYESWNLSVSCKRCNMQFKGEDIDFVVDKLNPANFQKKENYSFVHPNFDEWEQHLSRVAEQVNRNILVKYTIVNDSEKGKYTYKYFDLKALEVNSFDKAQGIVKNNDEEITESMAEARTIAISYGQ
jgi:5-methylcytosine-specific restriction endonuclease McrA